MSDRKPQSLRRSQVFSLTVTLLGGLIGIPGERAILIPPKGRTPVTQSLFTGILLVDVPLHHPCHSRALPPTLDTWGRPHITL